MSAERLSATYLVRAEAAGIDARARALAVEQSVEMPLDAIADQRVLDDVVARVEGIEPAGGGAFTVRLGLATSTIGGDLAQLVNMAFGNCSLQPDVELVDLDLRPGLIDGCDGPRYGVDGLRRLVGAAPGRPLTCSALKPQGLDPARLGRLAGTFARAGIDIVKDDHGLANQASAPFARRVSACQRAVEAANRLTGGCTRYAPSLVGGPRRLDEQLRIAGEEGVQVVLVAPMLVGLPAFAELAHRSRAGTSTPALLAHPAYAGAARVAPPLLLGTLFRLAGADATIFPNHGGRFAYTPELCRDLALRARRAWDGLAPTLPVPAGGMTPDRVGELVAFYGADVMLLVGGALLQAGDELEHAARAFVAATSRAAEEVA
jgi:ribulose-bisphosphate carboxylase large chain